MTVGKLLHAVGLRRTRARQVVLQVLTETDRPLDLAKAPRTIILISTPAIEAR